MAVSSLADPVAFDQLVAGMHPDGKDFERLCAWFLKADPEYAAEFEQVWLWRDWPGSWGRDKGIDLIAKGYDGRIIAIQAKHYSPVYSVKKADLDSFLSESNRASIDGRLLMATTELLGPNAHEVIEGQSKPVGLCLRSRLRDAPVRWPTSIGELAADAPIVLGLRPHQTEALTSSRRWAETAEGRGQVRMACGTGKSLVEVRAADELNAQLVLVLVPTLPLLRQTASVWASQSTISRKTLRVCSDQTDAESEQAASTSELGFPATTDPDLIAGFLNAPGPRVIYATYKSSPAIAQAMTTATAARFDLVIADEAHHCAGAAKRPAKTILDNERIRATRRLFFTATPTLFGPRQREHARNVNVALASMDDHELFGEVLYHLSFADAVERELLCPYQVAVIPIKDDEVQALIDDRRLVTADGERIFEASSMATQIACARAMRKFGAHRIVAFHHGIPASRKFAEHFATAAALLPADQRPQERIWSKHVDGGGMPKGTRIRVLREFESPGADDRILSNVKLLTEGVDVPAIDGVAFVDTHRGSASVIQAVGRAMRPAAGKDVGTVILPITVRKNEDIATALKRREHRDIVEILGALRSHDPDMFRSLDDLRFSARPDDQLRPPRRFLIDAPVDVDEAFADAVDVALTRALGTAGDRAPRRRVQPDPLAPGQSNLRPLTDEQIFDRGLEILHRYAHWGLAPAVPPDPLGFPLQTWWDEMKRRLAARTMGPDLTGWLADAVSWMAPDLGPPQSPVRRELRALTQFTVPEQLNVQMSRQGIYARGPLSVLIGRDRDFYDRDGLLEQLEAVHAQVTYVAMSHRTQRHAMVAALRPLAAIIGDEDEESAEVPFWARTAAMYGYIDRLKDDPQVFPHWSSRSDPEHYLAGYKAAEVVIPLVRWTALYRFEHDDSAILSIKREDALREPDDRLDELGWEIYLLARHQYFDDIRALKMARGTRYNNLAKRKATRAQLLGRPQHPSR